MRFTINPFTKRFDAYEQDTPGGGDIEWLVGNSGAQVGPNGASQVNVVGTATNGINIVGTPGTNTITIGFSGLYADGNQEFRNTVNATARIVSITNTANTIGSENSELKLSVGGGNAGNPFVHYFVTGMGLGSEYSLGVYNSSTLSSDRFTLSLGSAVLPAGNASNVIEINGATTDRASLFNIGSSVFQKSISGGTTRVYVGNTSATASSAAEIQINAANANATGANPQLHFNISGSHEEFVFGILSGTVIANERYCLCHGSVLYDSTNANTILEINPNTPRSAIWNLASKTIQLSNSGAAVYKLTKNTSNTAGSTAYHQVDVAGGTAADPYMLWTVANGATQNYSAGIDNSDSDKWKLTTGASPSAGTELLAFTTAGAATFANTISCSVLTSTSRTPKAVAVFGVGGELDDLGVMTNGQLIIGNTGNAPSIASLTAGAGVSITPGVGSITIAAVGGGFGWNTATVNTNLVVDDGYVTKNAVPANRLIYTLPATAAVGSTFIVLGYTSGGWRIAQQAGQQIFFGSSSTTIGAGGYIESTLAKDNITIICVTADTEFSVLDCIGNPTVV